MPIGESQPRKIEGGREQERAKKTFSPSIP